MSPFCGPGGKRLQEGGSTCSEVFSTWFPSRALLPSWANMELTISSCRVKNMGEWEGEGQDVDAA